ncbi:hypothetical protein L596_028149 [Steinernema carpocapsae]|uniref:Kinetochore protein Nuf2 N-terminal domain-containing protein n=1 Tax=Steinernema carpocapsae TaxID=34508 RepID=A0A4U5LXP4_STECR|nr:hypothetical protein L596_028149 [Steinernema carpocapsae]
MTYGSVITLDMGVILKYLTSNFPQLDVTQRKITHPQGMDLYDMYSTLLKRILKLPDRAFTEIPFEAICPNYDPDLHGQTVPKFLLLFHLNNCVQDITDKELTITPKDLFYPTPDRTRAILSALVSFHRFLNCMAPHIEKITQAQDVKLAAMRAVKERVEAGEKENLPEKVAEQKRKLDELKEEFNKVEHSAKGNVEGIEDERIKSVKLDEQIQERNTLLGQLQNRIISLHSQLELLKGDIVESPEEVMQKLEGLRAAREELAKRVDYLRRSIFSTEQRLSSFSTAQHRLKIAQSDCEDIKTRLGQYHQNSMKSDELHRNLRVTKQRLEDIEQDLNVRRETILKDQANVQRDREHHQNVVADFKKRIEESRRELVALRERGEEADHELEEMNRDYHRVLHQTKNVKEVYANKLKAFDNQVNKSKEKLECAKQKWNQIIEEKEALFKQYEEALEVLNDENESVAMETD